LCPIEKLTPFLSLKGAKTFLLKLSYLGKAKGFFLSLAFKSRESEKLLESTPLIAELSRWLIDGCETNWQMNVSLIT
jgi:hypothetical protein